MCRCHFYSLSLKFYQRSLKDPFDKDINRDDIILVLDEIEEVHRQKQNNLHLVFDGPKSFMEEDL